MTTYGPLHYFGPLTPDETMGVVQSDSTPGKDIPVVTHVVHPDAETTVTVESLDDLILHLAPQFGPEGLATRRSIDAAEVTEAFQSLEKAKKRVRVYSAAGFVPKSYRYRCDIQYVEANRRGDSWEWQVNWGSAQRSSGRAATKVVQ